MKHLHPVNGCCEESPFIHTNHCQSQCTMGCEHHVPPKHFIPRTPTGIVIENKFRIIDGMPYLVDLPLLKWGPHLKVSEQIDTKITQRPDQACIRLDAIFDCTNSFTANMMLNEYLTQISGRVYDDLQGTLPIIQEWTHFKLNYHITDRNGDTVYDDNAVVSTKESWLHLTEMRDQFVQSFKNIFMIEIPDFSQYGGMYTLNIDSLDVSVSGFDPKEHMEDPALNPYYAFSDSYKHIVIDHNKCAAVDPDYSNIPIASIGINKSFGYNANVTTRLKLAFTAYLTDLIITPNTFAVWSSLTQPTEEILDMMKTDIDTLEAEVTKLQGDVAAQTVEITNLKTLVEQQGETITTLVTSLQTMTETLEALAEEVNQIASTVNTLITTTSSTPPIVNDDDTQNNEDETTDPPIDDTP